MSEERVISTEINRSPLLESSEVPLEDPIYSKLFEQYLKDFDDEISDKVGMEIRLNDNLFPIIRAEKIDQKYGKAVALGLGIIRTKIDIVSWAHNVIGVEYNLINIKEQKEREIKDIIDWLTRDNTTNLLQELEILEVPNKRKFKKILQKHFSKIPI